MWQQHTILLRVILLMLLIAVAISLFAASGNQHSPGFQGYLYALFNYTGRGFSCILGAIFSVGAYIILDRAVFFVVHFFFSKRLRLGYSTDPDRSTVFSVFEERVQAAAGGAEFSEAVIGRLRTQALREMLNGREIDWGRSCLEFLGMIAPMVGFIGTLVGLISSFHELGLGGQITTVLGGLALAMTTSLLGAVISLVCISAAWLLGKTRQAFDAELHRIIAVETESV